MYFVLKLIALSLVVTAGSDRNLKNTVTGNKNRLKSVVTGSDQYPISGATGSDQYIQSVLGTKITIKPGRHVCTTEKVISKPVKVIQTYRKPIYTSHPRDCLNYNNCPQFDVNYEDSNRTVFLLQKSSSFRHSCCPGWTKGNKRGKGCMAPICTNGCGDFGVCVKPEVCECPRGYKGEMCDRDIDECQKMDHGCQQICKNTAGSYMCACQKGFMLAVDGKTCNYCYQCQKEYTDLVLSVESMKKSLSNTVLMQTEQVELFKTQQSTLIDKMASMEQEIRNLTDENTEQVELFQTQQSTMIDKMASMEQEIRNLTDENRRLEYELSDIHGKFDAANKEMEKFRNITWTTGAPPTTPTMRPLTTTTKSTTAATTTTATTTTATTQLTTLEYASQDQGLEFSQEDMMYSLSNQIGMMEEKLELCNCHARRRP